MELLYCAQMIVSTYNTALPEVERYENGEVFAVVTL